MSRPLTALLLAAVLALTGAAPGSEARPGRGDQDRDVARVASTVAGAVLSLATEAAAPPTVDRTRPQDVRPRAGWQWPLPGRPEVVKHFDPPPQPWLPGHRGVDLAGTQAAPVLAVDDGTVTYSGRVAGIGVVSVAHGDGLRSTYQPVTDRIDTGTRVRAGDQLGHLGDVGSHCLVRLCLHLGAVRGEETYLDPLMFLQPRELTLLPHGR